MSSVGPGLAMQPAGEPQLQTPSPASPSLFELNDSVLKIGKTTPRTIRCSRPRAAFLTLVTIGTILGLTLAMYFCRLKKKNHFNAREFLRRLAGREEGEEQESTSSHFRQETCGMLDVAEGLMPTHLLEASPFSLEMPGEQTSEGPPRKRRKSGDSSSSEVDPEEPPAVPPVDDWWLKPTEYETQEKLSPDQESPSSALSSSPLTQSEGCHPDLACLEPLSPLLDEEMDKAVQKSVQAYVASAKSKENLSYLVTVEAPDTLSNVAKELFSDETVLRQLIGLVEGEIDVALAPAKDTPSGPPVGESSADASSSDNISSPSPSIQQQKEVPSTSGAKGSSEHSAHSQTPSESEKSEEEGSLQDKTTRETIETTKESSAPCEAPYEFTLAAESSPSGDSSDLEARAAEVAQAVDPKEAPSEGSSSLLQILRKPQKVLPYPGDKNHPYYRLPTPAATQPEGSDMDRFDEHFVFFVAEPSAGAAAKLLPIREILLKSKVDEVDVRYLVHHGEQLVAYAFKYLTTDLRKKPLYRAREHLCRRVLAADALWALCEVVGPPMRKEVWWDKLMGLMAGTSCDKNQPRNAEKHPFVRDLVDALQLYREGNRPEPEVVVKLKRVMFRAPCMMDEFKSPLWEPWRQDDKLYGSTS